MKKSVFRVMSENKGQYIGMFFMVFLSSYLFVMLALVAVNMNTVKNDYFTGSVQGELEFYSADAIGNISEIEQKYSLRMDETLVRDYSFDDKTVRLFTRNDKVNIPAVTKGNLPVSGEIGLDPAFAKANGYSIGDAFYIDGTAYTISGYVCLPNYAYILQKEGDLVNDPNTFGIGVIAKEDASSGSHLYSVKYDAPEANIYEQAKPLKAYINEQGAGILSWTYAKYEIRTILPNIEAMAITAYSVVFPPVLMLLSAILIAVILRRMIKNQMGAIGTLYAMGYRKKEIMRHYMRYPLILGVSGGVIGSACGMAGVSPMLDMMLSFMPMPINSISYNPVFFLLSVALSVAILCFGTYAALNKMLGSNPVSLMKNEGKDSKPNFIERKLRLERMGFNKKFTVREQLRSLPRLAFLFIGIIAAVSLLITGLILKSSVDYLLAQDNDHTLQYKHEYVLNKPQTSEVPPGGEGIAGLRFVPDFDIGNRFEIIGSDPRNRLISIRDTKGNTTALDDKKAVISKTMAQKYKLGVGSVISFTDIIYDAKHSIEITDIADTSLGDVIFVSLNRFDNMLGWEQGSYNAIVSTAPLDIDQGLIYSINTPAKMADSLKGYTALMSALLYGIAVIAAVIGLIIIYILASISIDENKGNISLMKVFGYKKKEINALMINGSRLIVALGFIAAVPLAYLSIGGALEFVFNLLKVTVVTRLEWYYVLLAFVLTFLAFETSKAMCVRKIGKVSMSEALKSQRE